MDERLDRAGIGLACSRAVARAAGLLGVAGAGLLGAVGPADAQAIYEIQGPGRVSPFVDEFVTTSGVVTAVLSNGFFMQDAFGDGDPATSDGIFVFTGGTPSVAIGGPYQVSGIVEERFDKTQLNSFSVSELRAASPPIAPVVIGTVPGVDRLIPTEWIDNDANTSFDPTTDGLDFYEALEGMLVTFPDAQAVGPTNTRFGEVYAIANQGNGASGVNARGGVTIGLNANGPDTNNSGGQDHNPERLLIDDPVTGQATPGSIKMGDTLGDITGVLDYDFRDYRLRPLAPVNHVPVPLVQETTTLAGDSDTLLVASYNVLNLSANSSATKFDNLASQIVNNLNTPDIVALQEIQDNSGEIDNGVTAADQTLQALVDAIAAEGGPSYSFIDNVPVDGFNGGVPGGNIRTAYLYRDDRVTLTDPTGPLLGAEFDPAFFGSRKPLLGTFEFAGETIYIVNNHFTAKSGSDALFGEDQPPLNAQEGGSNGRIAQAQFVNDYIDGLLAIDPEARVLVLGDLNEWQFEDALLALAGQGSEQVLTNLDTLIADPTDLYSFVFEGNATLLDHALVSDALLGFAEYDLVHLNTGFSSSFQQLNSDHDPLLVALTVPEPGAVAGLGALLVAMGWRRLDR
ncbi:MAG: endonuclease/exonuclease/phosphatase family protein [Planctomycetota bacterium]